MTVAASVPFPFPNQQPPFSVGFEYAERHMPAIRAALGALPARIFFGIETASAKKDMEQATDLILSVSGGDIAVRVRRSGFWRKILEGKFTPDWSVRCYSHGWKTEIHKLREGFGNWYFYGYSADNVGRLAAWWLLDLEKVREQQVFNRKWPSYPNGDGTQGMYIPIENLKELGCVVASNNPLDKEANQ